MKGFAIVSFKFQLLPTTFQLPIVDLWQLNKSWSLLYLFYDYVYFMYDITYIYDGDLENIDYEAFEGWISRRAGYYGKAFYLWSVRE